MFMFEKLCRLCLTDKSVSSTLNNSDSDNITLLNKLNRIAPGLLKINSSLPIGICTTCIAHLNQACTFIKNCLRSQEILNKYLEQLQNGLDAEQSKNYEIVINGIKLEQNNAINYMNDMNIEQTGEEFHNTLVNYEKESDFIKQENIIEYNDDYESIQVNFEDDIRQEETNVKMEISEEECNYSIDIQSDINVKEECLSEEQLYETDIDEDDIDEEYIKLDLETDINIKVEESLESQNNTNVDTVCMKEEAITEDYTEEAVLETDTNIKFEESLKSESLDLHSEIIIKEEYSDFENEIDIKHWQASRDMKKNNIFSPKENGESVKKRKSHKCTLCQKTFTRNNNLKRHIRSHTNERPYKCEICDKAFTQSGHLKDHIRIHTNERPYKCEICEKTFTQSGDLKKHIRSHTNERPYKCKICDKAFTHSGHLKAHTRIHINERPYKCEICDKAFTLSGHLKVHIRIHTNEKPYKCEICERTFMWSGQLKQHVRSHAKKKPDECQIKNFSSE